MQYSQKYPNAKYLDMIDNDILVGKELKPCSFCGELTNFIEINSEAHFCSEECVNAWYKDFWEHNQPTSANDFFII